MRTEAVYSECAVEQGCQPPSRALGRESKAAGGERELLYSEEQVRLQVC